VVVREGPARERAGVVALEPARVFAAQVKATPDLQEATELASALQRAGVVAAVHRADLGPRGVWFRVTVGDWPRKDLLEARAPGLVASGAVSQALGPTVAAEAPFVAQDVPRIREPEGGLLAALAAWPTGAGDGGAGTGVPPTAYLAPGRDGALRAYVAEATDGTVVVLGAKGQRVEVVSAPAAGCPGCAGPAGPWRVALAWDLAGPEDPEVALEGGPEDRRAWVLVARSAAGHAPVLSLPVAVEEGGEWTVGEVAFRQLDADADLEILWTGARLTFAGPEVLCAAVPLASAHDLVPGPGGLQARSMDGALHAANGVARRHGGAEEVRAFLRGTWERAPDLALEAALAYLAQAPDDADVYREVVSRAEQAGREGRKLFQLAALAGLVAARGEWSAGLAPRLHDLLPEVIRGLGAARGRPCADRPLLSGVAARRARTDPREALAAASRRLDAAPLGPREVAGLSGAYPQGSPLAEDVRHLMAWLEENQPGVAAEAKQLLAARRAPARVEPLGVPVPPKTAPAAAPSVLDEDGDEP
jgi:hypothetical protein